MPNEERHRRGSVPKEFIVDYLVSRWFWPWIFRKLRAIKDAEENPVGEDLWMSLAWYVRESEDAVNVIIGGVLSGAEWLKDLFMKLPVPIHDLTDEVMGQTPRAIIAYFNRAENQSQIPEGYRPKFADPKEMVSALSHTLKIHLPRWRGELIASIPLHIEKLWRSFVLGVVETLNPAVDGLTQWIDGEIAKIEAREQARRAHTD